ncbi:hypothetical protein [Streptomyces sp. SH5]|uniref:hypothetical protein n=1 Tax=Streptomyces sp. SH5 TaxID=3041765 RepID=UPI00247816D2|nr:hypothetical protein [Streptomyces sp. SH5]WGP11426.1 hypothetical protein QFA72_17990 [Streptomyces sp. SH5]
MPENKIDLLLDRLAQATSDDAIEWNIEPGEWGDPDKYTTSLTRNTLSLWAKDNDGLPPFIFLIHGPDGQVVEELRGADHRLQMLFDAVRRKVLKVDETLDQIIIELNRRISPF